MLRLLSTIAFRKWIETVRKICLKIYQTQEKSQQIISSHVEANLETTFDYCSPEIARKCAEDMSDDIPDTEKIPKNYCARYQVILVHSLRLFSHFDTPEIDRNQSQDMSDDISETGKISKNYSEPFEAY